MDINGNTLLHLAAKYDSYNIALLLKNIYSEESQDVEDRNIAIEKSASPYSGTYSKKDQYLFFDVNKTNN